LINFQSAPRFSRQNEHKSANPHHDIRNEIDFHTPVGLTIGFADDNKIGYTANFAHADTSGAAALTSSQWNDRPLRFITVSTCSSRFLIAHQSIE
jgi:hypothetical protein